MNIEKINVMPVKDSINPELLFEIEFSLKKEYEVPIEITGSLYSDENKKIANVHKVIHELNSMKLSAEFQKNYALEKLTLKLIAPLNHKVLDYIDTLRTKDRNGDVNLTLDIFVKTLLSNTIITPVTKDIGLRNELTTQIASQGNSLLAYRNRDFSPDTDLWILSGKGNPTFIEVKDNHFIQKVIIHSSEWINKYCPEFQIGRFSVFEYLLPDYTKGSGSKEERLNESIKAIIKMQENLISGDWNGVIEDSRAVWELLKDEVNIKDLLKSDSYTDEAINELFGYTDKKGCKHSGCIGNLFLFSSKFMHRLDKDKKKIMPEIKASKEDAYLIYALSMNFVNLISKKMQRLKSSNL